MTPEPEIPQKNILVTGASGMIGSALSAALTQNGYRVYPLIRNKSDGPHYYLQESDYMHLDSSIPLHGIVNLAGQNISKKRWTQKVKNDIVDSRVKLTRSLSEAISQLPAKPEIFLSASAIGYYGTHGSKSFDENDRAGTDFLATLASVWEDATKAASQSEIPTVCLRFGLVLHPNDGILKNLLLPFRLACVGPIGSGEQTMSWISLRDAVTILIELISQNNFTGPLNVVSNQPVSNRDFSKALARSIHRLSLPRIPSPIVRIMFGEMADAALLPSASIKSTRMQELGIELEDLDLSSALNKMFS